MLQAQPEKGRAKGMLLFDIPANVTVPPEVWVRLETLTVTVAALSDTVEKLRMQLSKVQSQREIITQAFYTPISLAATVFFAFLAVVVGAVSGAYFATLIFGLAGVVSFLFYRLIQEDPNRLEPPQNETSKHE